MSARKRSVRSNRVPEAAAVFAPAFGGPRKQVGSVAGGSSPIQRITRADRCTAGGAPPVTLASATADADGSRPFPRRRRARLQDDDQAPNGGLVPDQSPAARSAIPRSSCRRLTAVPSDISILRRDQGRRCGPDNRGHRRRQQPELPADRPEVTSEAHLQVFDKTFGLPDPPTFRNVQPDRRNDSSRAGAGLGPGNRTRHRMGALDRPDRQSRDRRSLGQLALRCSRRRETAVTKLGASVVSMSFGGHSNPAGFGSIEAVRRSNLLRACAGRNPNVTFLASTGDSGADLSEGRRPQYPSLSPASWRVGGTTLNLTKTNQWQSEIGWSYGSDSFAPESAGAAAASAPSTRAGLSAE